MAHPQSHAVAVEELHHEGGSQAVPALLRQLLLLRQQQQRQRRVREELLQDDQAEVVDRLKTEVRPEALQAYSLDDGERGVETASDCEEAVAQTRERNALQFPALLQLHVGEVLKVE